MNVYIYDSYVSERKHNQTVAKIETRVTDLGLNGKIVRLGLMNSVFDIVDNEIKKGAKTIVAVGNLSLLCLCVNALACLYKKNSAYAELPLGFIPVGKANNSIAAFLGLELEEEACDSISARRIQTLDLGLVDNDKYFLTSAQIPTEHTIIEINTHYSIEITKPGKISVVNIPFNIPVPAQAEFNGNDGNLELLIEEKSGGFLDNKSTKTSVFAFDSLLISNKKHALVLDETLKVSTPSRIQVAKEKINLIVGKNRGF